APMIAYFDHRFPLRPDALPELGGGSALDTLNADTHAVHRLLEAQHYRLAWWRSAVHDLNYRRFFDISPLAGLRVEDPVVFDAVHARILAWVDAGVVDGLRIDHPDGLRDPAEYVRQLRRRAPGAWITVEKILERGELLAQDWPVDGTTGYDWMRMLTGVFVDSAAKTRLSDAYTDFVAAPRDLAETVAASKQFIVKNVLAAEVNRLAALAHSICRDDPTLRDFSRNDLHRVIEALVRAMPVYRTYCTLQEVSPADAKVIEEAIIEARQLVPEVDARLFAWFASVWRHEDTDPRALELADRFQQLSGPAMAKGVEDTAFYRYMRLIALNEVGADPGAVGVSVDELHRFATQTARAWPTTMVATSTHDTKRSEDVRVRIALLAAAPQILSRWFPRWRDRNAPYWGEVEPDRDLEYLIYQTLVGAHPLPRERAHTVITKSMREAKVRTSWLHPDEHFESAVHGFVDAIFDDEHMQHDLDRVDVVLAGPGRLASLSQLLLKATLPGVPDFYQGSELWMDSLVDPDNRRDVDYAERDALLATDAGNSKMWLTARLLAIRRRHCGAFVGDGATYEPLTVTGALAGGVVAFARGASVVTVACVRPLAAKDEPWRQTFIDLPHGTWTDALGPGRAAQAAHAGRVRLSELASTSRLRLAMLERTS
ncbi:MAG TPA: malto-oligosyltrehalose synthase, partial [Ilumatobacteraceae bacterium]